MRRALLAVLMAAFTVAFVVGCGDDDGDTTAGDGAETLTKAEFIERGDEICAKAERRSEKEAEAFAEENGFELANPTQKQVEDTIAAVLVPALDTQAEELAALGAPAGDEEQVDEIVVALEDAADAVADDPASAFEGKPLNEASDLAEAYGFEECGEG